MSRVLQNILRKKRAKVHYRTRQAALLMAMANSNHQAVAQLIKNWLSDIDTA